MKEIKMLLNKLTFSVTMLTNWSFWLPSLGIVFYRAAGTNIWEECGHIQSTCLLQTERSGFSLTDCCMYPFSDERNTWFVITELPPRDNRRIIVFAKFSRTKSMVRETTTFQKSAVPIDMRSSDLLRSRSGSKKSKLFLGHPKINAIIFVINTMKNNINIE